MKRFLLLCVALVALVFVGCTKDDAGHKVDGKSIEGRWVCVAEKYDGDYYEFYDQVDTIFDIKGDTGTEYYHPYDCFLFEDGYIYGTSFEEFESDPMLVMSIKGDYVSILGIPCGKLSFQGDRLRFESTFTEEESILYFERLKGFRE